MRYAVAVRIAAAATSAIALVAAVPATAPAQDACPNAQFRTGASAGLPDCRAWEQVSPVDKDGQAVSKDMPTYSTPDGSRFLHGSTGGIVPTDGAMQARTFMSSRAADWSTKAIEPPMLASKISGGSSRLLEVSDDGTKALVITSDALTPEARPDNSNIYVRDLTKPNAYTLALAIPGIETYETRISYELIDATPDLSTFAIALERQVLPDVEPDEFGRRLYRVRDGRATLASRLPSGEPALVSSTVLADDGRHDLSEDGDTLFWIEDRPGGGAGKAFVMRADDSVVEASAPTAPGDPQRTIPTTVSTPDGSSTYFSSNVPLTPGSAGNRRPGLYRYDTRTGALDDLLAPVQAQAPTDGFGNLDILRVSPDGAVVWFVSYAPLEAASGTDYATRLYALDVASRTVRLVVKFAPGGPSGSQLVRDATVSPNGRRIAILSPEGPLGDTRTSPSCRDSPYGDDVCSQVYTWNAEARDSPPLCVSCTPRGGEQTDKATFGQILAFTYATRLSRKITDDGRVFFDTTAREPVEPAVSSCAPTPGVYW